MGHGFLSHVLRIPADASVTLRVRTKAWSCNVFRAELMEQLGTEPRVLASLLRHFKLSYRGD